MSTAAPRIGLQLETSTTVVRRLSATPGRPSLTLRRTVSPSRKYGPSVCSGARTQVTRPAATAAGPAPAPAASSADSSFHVAAPSAPAASPPIRRSEPRRVSAPARSSVFVFSSMPPWCTSRFRARSEPAKRSERTPVWPWLDRVAGAEEAVRVDLRPDLCESPEGAARVEVARVDVPVREVEECALRAPRLGGGTHLIDPLRDRLARDRPHRRADRVHDERPFEVRQDAALRIGPSERALEVADLQRHERRGAVHGGGVHDRRGGRSVERVEHPTVADTRGGSGRILVQLRERPG